MIQETIEIKLLPNPDNPKLGMKFVGAKDYLQALPGPDGKPMTGLDENAYAVTQIEDSAERKKVQKEIKTLREELEKLLGVTLDPFAEFWRSFYYVLEEGMVLDPVNPRDRLIERFLIANHFVAPDQEAIFENEDFHHCLFFFYRHKEAISKKAKEDLDRDKATTKLLSLFENNPSKLQIVHSFVLGFDGSEGLEPLEMYTQLRNYIISAEDVNLSTARTKQFLEAEAMTPETMSIKNLLDKAVKKKAVIVKRNVYQRGDEVYGKGYEEALEYLKSPSNTGELSSLRKELEKI